VGTGDLLVEMLINYGVKFVFGLPGTQLPLYDAIHRRSLSIHHILLCDERNAAYAADGYARVTNKVGVCDATVGPGAIKLVSGLAEAYNSSIPVLSISDGLPYEWLHLAHRGGVAQGMDQLGILQPVTKWVVRVPSQAKLPEVLHLAFARATGGRPGPVSLIIPAEVFSADWEDDAPNAEGVARYGQFPVTRPQPDTGDVKRAVEVLSQAERPLILAGGGVNISEAQAELRALAEARSIPVATTVAGKSCMAETDPLNVGVVGTQYGEECANIVLREADVVMMVGCKTFQRTFGWSLPGDKKRVVHLDIAPDEIGKVVDTEVGLVADARAALQSILAVAGQVPVRSRSAWLRRAQKLKAAWEASLEAETRPVGKPIRPQAVMAELRNLVGPDDVMVTDASFSIGWVVSFLDGEEDGQKFLFPRGAAGLGFGLGAAIGARFARPDGKVVLLSGDGGFAYSVMELGTLRKYDLDVKVIVLNNTTLSYIRMNMKLRGGDDFHSADLPEVDFSQVAQGYDCTGIRIEEPEDLSGALSRAFDVTGPVVVDVVSSGWETPELELRKKFPGASNAE
jgi:acetolactate synthase-1/2/3 large subunit